jgi:hypothetical protein
MKQKFLLIIAMLMLAPTFCYAQASSNQNQQPAPPPQVAKKLGEYTIAPANPNTIIPGQIMVELKPGDTYSDAFIVENKSDSVKKITLYPADSVTVNGEINIKNNTDKQENIGKWTKFETNEITLQPREKKQVGFTITIPANAAFGNFKGGFNAVESPEIPKNQSGIFYSTRIVLMVKVKITDNPQHIPLRSEINLFTSVLSSATPYFWTSLGLFTLGIIYFIYGILREKKNKQKPQDINVQ